MPTFKILNGFDNNTLELFRSIWKESDLNDSEYFTKITADEYQDYVFIKKHHKLYDYFKSYFKFDFTLLFLINQPYSGLGPIHTDGSRKCAINFPIQVDLKNSNFIAAKTFDLKCTIRAPEKGEPINNDALRFEYEPQKYDFYNLEKPILVSTKVAHSAYNYSKDQRVLLSLTPNNMSYYEVGLELPKEWI